MSLYHYQWRRSVVLWVASRFTLDALSSVEQCEVGLDALIKNMNVRVDIEAYYLDNGYKIEGSVYMLCMVSFLI